MAKVQVHQVKLISSVAVVGNCMRTRNRTGCLVVYGGGKLNVRAHSISLQMTCFSMGGKARHLQELFICTDCE